ncbi:MAG TPA: class I SAM-dependent methyltransferase [Casimicrobiaceae bacterium]|nr:class I SAM-dependent methyltransferase [Casimicrobiaceae bacterium]
MLRSLRAGLLTPRLLRARLALRRSPSDIEVGSSRFVCNVCGCDNARALPDEPRDTPSCRRCGSNVRFRTIAYLVTTEVLGTAMPLPDLRKRRDICGVGLSDAGTYARYLARKLSYRNTFFHTHPRLDITSVPAAESGRYDFVIASDVFEHVAPPVERAFDNARRLLKPGGKLIFTVPFSLDADTVEHYPDLHDYRVVQQMGRWRLYNRTRAGEVQVFDDPVFHGGPGSTLEMRVFSRTALQKHFADAGFARIRFADEAYAPFGIAWPVPWSVPIVAYAA